MAKSKVARCRFWAKRFVEVGVENMWSDTCRNESRADSELVFTENSRLLIFRFRGAFFILLLLWLIKRHTLKLAKQLVMQGCLEGLTQRSRIGWLSIRKRWFSLGNIPTEQSLWILWQLQKNRPYNWTFLILKQLGIRHVGTILSDKPNSIKPLGSPVFIGFRLSYFHHCYLLCVCNSDFLTSNLRNPVRNHAPTETHHPLTRLPEIFPSKKIGFKFNCSPDCTNRKHFALPKQFNYLSLNWNDLKFIEINKTS